MGYVISHWYPIMLPIEPVRVRHGRLIKQKMALAVELPYTEKI